MITLEDFADRFSKLKPFERRTIRLHCSGLNDSEIAEIEEVGFSAIRERMRSAGRRLVGSEYRRTAHCFCYMLGACDATIGINNARSRLDTRRAQEYLTAKEKSLGVES